MKIMLDQGAFIPRREHKTDAGMDLFSRESKVIQPFSREVFNTGVHVELPPDTFGKLESKSGLSRYNGIVCPGGTIDQGYSGAICVILYNLSNIPYSVSSGDKLCQLIVQPCLFPEVEIVDEITAGDRGKNGFGSTGR